MNFRKCSKCGRLTVRRKPFPRPVICCGVAMLSLTGEGYVGTFLMGMMHQLGFRPKKGCGCAALRREMDAAGVSGCRERFHDFCGKLREKYDATTWGERARAGGLAVLTGLAFSINPLDPVPSILTEAIRLATSPSSRDS